MEFLSKFNIGTKIVIVTTLVVIVYGTGVLLFTKNWVEFAFIDYVLDGEKEKIDRASLQLETIFEYLRNDILALSQTPPVQGIFRAQKGGGVDEKEGDTLEEWENRLANIFITSIENKEFYYQLRYIDENGQEIVRVDFKDGSVYRVPENELQNKSDRFYFKEANILMEGESYVSSPTLNREGTPPEIEIPYSPVLRCAIPVFDEGNKRKGIIIANIFFDVVLEKIGAKNNGLGNTVLVDQDGNYLLHQNKEKEWGGEKDLNTGENIKKDFPEIAQSVLYEEGEIISKEKEFYFFDKVLINEGVPFIFVVFFEKISSSVVLAPFSNFFIQTILVSVGLFFFVALIIFLFIKRILGKPLNELMVGVAEIEKGNFGYETELETEDELGELSNAFNKMSLAIKKSREAADKIVKE